MLERRGIGVLCKTVARMNVIMQPVTRINPNHLEFPDGDPATLPTLAVEIRNGATTVVMIMLIR